MGRRRINFGTHSLAPCSSWSKQTGQRPATPPRREGPRLQQEGRTAARWLELGQALGPPGLRDILLGWLMEPLQAVEHQGHLAACLAKDYTIIHKVGPPGPVNMRPLTVLSMGYRLWAGVRLVDTIRY